MTMRTSSERGVALMVTLMVTLLMSALMVGFTTVIMSDQRFRSIDRDRSKAFYAAHSGLEKLTADLGDLFGTTVAPTGAQLASLTTTPPTIPGITFESAQGTPGYTLTAKSPISAQIQSGPFQGLIALKTVYSLDSTARTAVGGEVHLTRGLETVAIPVFQFGMFSSVDLSFFAGPNFDFGGRVHTNGNLFLAEGSGNTLTMRDKVTAFGQVVRSHLSNGRAITSTTHIGTVNMARATNSFLPLTYSPNQGSVVGDANSGANASWPSISLSTYNGWIRTGLTGARSLDLPAMTGVAANVGIIRRPAPNEQVSDPDLLAQRYFARSTLRILLSDAAADITGLPTVTATPPVQLDGNWIATPPDNGTVYGPISATRPPVASSPGRQTLTTNGTAVAAGANITITMNGAGVTPFFRPPTNISVQVGAGTVTVTCTSRTATTFFGCGPLPAGILIGSQVTAVVNSAPAQTTVAAPVPAVGATTFTVASTAGFAPGVFWVGDDMLQCTGNTTTQLRGCRVLVNIPAAATTISTAALHNAGISPIGGFIKIEMMDNAGVWQDVTMEILNYGISDRNVEGAVICANPTPDAILRLQRLKDNPATGGVCNYAGSINSWDHWPNTLFDAREGLQRDVSPGTQLAMGGVMHYLNLDVTNLSRWLQGIGAYNGGSGTNARADGGFSVYFSDRRGNRNALNQETGEYGFEDFVNPNTAGVPNNVLDVGEDVNGNTLLETYGQFPSYNGVASTVPPLTPVNVAPYTGAARPTTLIARSSARVNRPIFFRRALKLTNGGLGNIIMPGLTVASENPVYIQGDWNANAAGFGNPSAATSVVADAVTLLSNNWSDRVSFSNPYAPGGRPRAANTFYRLAIISGKGPSFPWPAATPDDFGTDGGAHNFLRYLEGGGGTLNFRGSIVTFFFNRQGVGTYKCCTTVYGAPTRAYAFDTNFLNPALLPPLTPVFRDLNTLGFSQELRPGR